MGDEDIQELAKAFESVARAMQETSDDTKRWNRINTGILLAVGVILAASCLWTVYQINLNSEFRIRSQMADDRASIPKEVAKEIHIDNRNHVTVEQSDGILERTAREWKQNHQFKQDEQ